MAWRSASPYGASSRPSGWTKSITKNSRPVTHRRTDISQQRYGAVVIEEPKYGRQDVRISGRDGVTKEVAGYACHASVYVRCNVVWAEAAITSGSRVGLERKDNVARPAWPDSLPRARSFPDDAIDDQAANNEPANIAALFADDAEYPRSANRGTGGHDRLRLAGAPRRGRRPTRSCSPRRSRGCPAPGRESSEPSTLKRSGR